MRIVFLVLCQGRYLEDQAEMAVVRCCVFQKAMILLRSEGQALWSYVCWLKGRIQLEIMPEVDRALELGSLEGDL